jgi:ribonuclease III
MVDYSKFSAFEQKIGIQWHNKDLLVQAFTHRSYINESRIGLLFHNERLEFLGDAVLELIITEYLFRKYPDRPEGELTSFRSALVNTTTLSQLSQKLGVNEYLLLSKGEAKDTGRARQFILADAFEAIVGAIYLDAGHDGAKKFIGDNLFPLTDEIVKNNLWQDAKSRLQEKSQEFTAVTPYYKILDEQGPDHNKQFICGAFINDEMIAQGEGKSKQEAEQSAARASLDKKGW